MTIWKFHLPIGSQLELNLPKGSQILCVHENKEMVGIWFLVDPSKDHEVRSFYTVGTGWGDSTPSQGYVGTAHIGEYVWHVFEV